MLLSNHTNVKAINHQEHAGKIVKGFFIFSNLKLLSLLELKNVKVSALIDTTTDIVKPLVPAKKCGLQGF